MNGEQLVLDPASGSRMFYFDRLDDRVVFGDKRSEEHELCDGRLLTVAPDVQLDFRALPFADGTFRVVVFDPPHLARAGIDSYMALKYGVLDRNTWRDDLARGFAECFRVLANHGVLIFKWNETHIPVSQILALTPHAPLVGNRSGKRSGTHWVTFLKEASDGEVSQ